MQKVVPPHNTMGREEVRAVTDVVRSGNLSQFRAAWHPDFFGGPKVQELESECASFFGVKHALTVNSWTSGLIAAVGAIGTEPGDEIILPPFTMSASATSILHWNAIPVFADIDPVTFCINPESVEANIGPHTRAIMTVDIFGHPSNSEELMAIALKNNLKVISDSAQAPGARVGDQFVGTDTDIGGFSLNYHKTIHSGEGGVVVTNDDLLAENVAMIRNHAEGVVQAKSKRDLVNMVGFNFRMGEMEAAIGIEQLRKLPQLFDRRANVARRLDEWLSGLTGLTVPHPPATLSHAYHAYPMELDCDLLGVSRERILEALRAEGIPGLRAGYTNIHLLPLFQQRIAFGSKGFPWSSFPGRPVAGYTKGIAPVAERLQDQSFMALALGSFDFTEEDIDLVGQAFLKVWESLGELR